MTKSLLIYAFGMPYPITTGFTKLNHVNLKKKEIVVIHIQVCYLE